MRYHNEILNSIETNFESRINNQIKSGSVINLYSSAIASTLEEVYDEIEKNKNPHVWSKLFGKELDATGVWVNLPRNENESDSSYRYRLMNWVLRNEASNTKAIQDGLLWVKYAENIDYIPQTRGCGTGTCYVLPKEYTRDSINLALAEAKDLMKRITSPSLYIEYIVPTILPVTLDIYISSKEGDITYLKKEIEEEIRYYINSIPPYDHMTIKTLSLIGLNRTYVDYFNILGVFINNKQISSIDVLQGIDTKLILDKINWTEGEI